MEKLKEELENMNDLMEQKDTLTQKLEVNDEGRDYVLVHMFSLFTSQCRDPANNVSVSPSPGDGAAWSGAGGAAGGGWAAAGGEPRGAGELQEEPANATGAAGRQDLWADGAQRHLGSAHRGGQLETELPNLHRPYDNLHLDTPNSPTFILSTTRPNFLQQPTHIQT